MRNAKRLVLFVILVWIILVLVCSGPVHGSDPQAADLVRAVRESENWIHKIDSLYIRIESKWTKTQEAIAARSAELKQQFPDQDIVPNQFPELKTVSTEILEYAIDQTRVRFLDELPDQKRQLKIWDGKQLIVYEASFHDKQEQYFLKRTPQGSFQELIAYETSWPRAQPHSFWWDQKDTDELLNFYGRPEEFSITGRCNYRGVDCFVLEVSPAGIFGLVVEQSYPGCNQEDRSRYGLIGQARGLAGRSYQWYIGAKDHLLYGFVWLDNKKPFIERWLLDYQQIVLSCWFPMNQGQKVYEKDASGQYCLASSQDLKVIDIRVNEKLSDELFQMKFKEGVKVTDNRFGRTVTYTYRPDPPDLVGKEFPKYADLNTSLSDEQAKDKKILVCFWDIEQRPSRNCLLQLSTKAQELTAKDVVVFAVQASKIDEGTLSEWAKKNNIPFPVSMVQADEGKNRYTWGVKSLPWLILTDKKRVVAAEGFAVDELGEKITKASIRKEQ